VQRHIGEGGVKINGFLLNSLSLDIDENNVSHCIQRNKTITLPVPCSANHIRYIIRRFLWMDFKEKVSEDVYMIGLVQDKLQHSDFFLLL
jgi:hypothetical protein